MREPIIKFGKQPASPDRTRKMLDECRAMLAKPSLSPELREGLKARIVQLEEELRTGTPPQKKDNVRADRGAD